MPAWLPTVDEHFAFSAICLLIYVINTRMQSIRRPPTSAIAWVAGLLVLPYLIFPLYFVFGRRKITTARSSRQVHDPGHPHWAAGLIATFDLPAPSQATVRFHGDGTQARAALLAVIDGARSRIDICTFLIADDVLGREVLEHLTIRASQGVRVRLMIDAAGRLLTSSPSFTGLRAAGAEVAQFHPLLISRHRAPGNLRDHRKLVVADNRRLWAGGRNLAAEYFCGDKKRPVPWIDLSFDLEGSVAEAAGQQFERDWGGSSPGWRSSGGVSGDSPVQFLPSGPDQCEDTIQTLLVAACFRAEDRIIAVTPYFVPDVALLNAMRLAALRGVLVQLVIPLKSNHRLTDFVRSRGLRALAGAGAEIRLIPQMVHAKGVVIDQTLAISGSANLDGRSLLLNYESAFVFYGSKEIAWLANWIESLAAKGSPFVAARPGLFRDLAEGLLLAMAFQL